MSSLAGTQLYTRLVEFLGKKVRHFLPEDFNQSDRGFHRANAMVWSAYLGQFISLIFAANFLLIGFTVGIYTLIALSLSAVIFLDTFKKSGNIILFANIFTACVFIVIIINTCFTGGIYSAVAPWLMILPIYGFNYGNKKSGQFWTLLASLSYIGMAVIDALGHPLPFSYDRSFDQWMYAFTLVTLLLYVLMLAQIHLNSTIESLRQVHRIKTNLANNLEIVSRHRRKLARISTTDNLTGLWNRYYLKHYFKHDINRVVRDQHPVVIAMLDLDFFKRINDEYGHHIGDECLIALANELSSFFKRASDVVARTGGEEFLVIMENVRFEQADQILENLRQDIEALSIETSLANIQVTISIGFTFCHPNAETDFDEVIDIADKALYQAKEGGRNQVVFLPFADQDVDIVIE